MSIKWITEQTQLLSESVVKTDLHRRGRNVVKPELNLPYDLVIDVGKPTQELVAVKSGKRGKTVNRGSKAKREASQTNESKQYNYIDEGIDWIAIVDLDLINTQPISKCILWYHKDQYVDLGEEFSCNKYPPNTDGPEFHYPLQNKKKVPKNRFDIEGIT